MGTDGLWEKLTNEQVVGLVGKYLDKASGREAKKGWFKATTKEGFDVVSGEVQKEGNKRPSSSGGDKSHWVWQDKNVATHLIRNALGGGNLDEVSIPWPSLY